MISRRSMFIGLATATAAGAAAAGRGVTQDVRRAPGVTSPHRSAREILARALPRIDHGARGVHDRASAVHRNFPQIVEQNFAVLADAAFNRMFLELTPLELQALSEHYGRACAEAARQPRLLDLFAERADATRLAELAIYFGPLQVRDSLMRMAPERGHHFDQALARQARASLALAVGTSAPSAAAPPVALTGPTVDYTLYEIYLAYRTAPIGALSVRAALYQASMFAGGHLGIAWWAGKTVGEALAPLIEAHAPGMWESIGGAVHSVVEGLTRATEPVTRALWQIEGAQTFSLTSFESMMMSTTGGDYGVVRDWWQYNGGGSSGQCGPNQWCPPYFVY